MLDLDKSNPKEKIFKCDSVGSVWRNVKSPRGRKMDLRDGEHQIVKQFE